MGELLREFQNAGARTDLEPGDGDGPGFDDLDRYVIQEDGTARLTPRTQREAAKRAGISKRQEKTARRVAEVPEEEFEKAIESDDLAAPVTPPPTPGSGGDLG